MQRDLYFNNLSLEEGLNQSAIYSLIKDPFGFTWIGTQDGLHRFDGNTIELVPLSNTELPKYRYIRDLKIIHEQLYVATTDGLVVLSLKTGEKTYPNVNNTAIYSVVAVNKHIWLGTNKGLLILNSDHKKIEYLGKFNDSKQSFCHIKLAPKPCYSEIRTLIFDQIKQTVWLGTNVGLFEINLDKKKTNKNNDLNNYITYYQIDTINLSANAIRKLFIDSHHRLWIASYYGLHYLSLQNTAIQKKIHHIYHQKEVLHTLAGNRVLAIAEDNDGYLWVGTGNGLSRHKNSSVDIDFNLGWQNFHTHNLTAHSLVDNRIRSLLTDAEGRIWVGTNRGVSVTNTQRNKVATFRGIERNEFNNYILSIMQESQNKYWIGTQKGLFVFENEVATLLPQMQKNTVYDTVLIDHSLWVATRQGLFKLDINNHKILHHYNIKNSPIGEAYIYKIIKIKDSLWMATTSGLHQLNLISHQWRSWYEKDGLVDSEIYTLYKFQEKLWIGTAKGLSIFDLNNQDFKNYSPQNSNLQSPWIFNIHHLSDDRFWLATDGGVYELNTTNESIHYIGITKGNAYSLIKDDQELMWITSNNGLYRFNPKTNEIDKFVEHNGFASNEYNLNASLKNSEGELFLGTINGLVKFTPTIVSKNTTPLKTRIVTSIQVEEKYHSLWDKLTIFNHSAMFLAHEFYLDWQNVQIELNLSNPYFAITSPSQNQDLIRSISLSNLKSGSYPILLSSKKNNAIEVTKAPHPLLSWWAILLYIAFFSTLLTLLIRYRLMHKYNKEILANHEVIAFQKDEIEQHLLFKQSLYLQIQHSFKSPVFACRGLSKQIANLLTNNVVIDKVSIERKNNKLSTALEEISGLIDDFIVLTKNEPIKNTFTKQYVVATLRKIENMMNDIASNKNVSLVFIKDNSVSEHDYIFASDKSLYLILENILSNAIKFSNNHGSVQVKTSRVNDLIEITITDNGCGFSRQDLNNIFTLYYRSEKSQQFGGSGVGLTTIKRLIDEQNGEIHFEKNIPNGTIVIIKLPVELCDGSR